MSSMMRSFSFCLLVMPSTLVALGADWPTYQHDNQRTGVTREKLAPPLGQRWVFESPFPPAKGWARPVNGYGATKNASNVGFDDSFRVVAVGDRAYFASSAENRIYAVNASRGTIAWTFFTDAPPRLAPTVWKDKIYFGSDDGTAWCLNAADGSVVWKIRCAPTREKMLGAGRFLSLWPMRTDVMVENGVAYFTAGLFPSEGVYFFAVNAENGSILWRRQLDRGGLGGPSPQGYLLASKDSIYMTSRVAPTRWSIRDGRNIPFQTPVPHHEYRFHNGGSYAQLWNERIVYGQAAILAYDPNAQFVDKYNRQQRGKLVFNWFNSRRVIFKDDVAFFATDYHILAVRQDLLPDLAKAECQQFEDAYKSHRVASYLTALETLAEHGEDSPIGRQLKNTSLKWGREQFEQWPAAAEKIFEKFAEKCTWMTPVKATDAMILAGDVIYAGGERQVVALHARTGKVLWRDETGSPVRGLAVANQRLFVSTIDGNVRCYSPGPHEGKPKEIRAAANPESSPRDRLTDFYANTAERIVRDSGASRGYCLILGGGTGRLAREIARRTKLQIYVLEPDAAKVESARNKLAAAGLYGGRITVEQSPPVKLPFPPYAFNLVIDEGTFFGGKASASCEEILRVTKPCGGVAFVGQPPGGAKWGKPLDPVEPARTLKGLHGLNAQITLDGSWAKVVRGPIKDSTDWTHNYATAANTYCSEDPLVKGPFGILWFGEPGPRKRIERHATGPIPLVVNGRMFLTGYDLVMAYDVYNGVALWKRTILGATRTGLPIGTSNLAADKTSLFIVIGDKECLRLDAGTGSTVKRYPAPKAPGAEENYWGWIARHGDLLFGSRCEVDQKRRRANRKTSEAVFAIDAATGRLVWTYRGKGIEHDGIAIGDGKVFLLDRNLTDAQRRQAVTETFRDQSVEDRKPLNRKGEPVPPDLRKLVALDATTGAVKWQKPLNATDITLDDAVVSDGRVAAACMVKDNVVVVHGTGSLGHPYREFLDGQFARRAIYAFVADTGKFLWGGRKNYRKRPIIVGDHVYAEPHAWNLTTGKPKTYTHPLSGQQEKFDCFRGYIGCSHLLGSGKALFGNMNGIAHLNLDQTCGYTPHSGMALACGLGAVPANGVFAAPEGRSGCTCATPIYTSVVLYPRTRARTFSLGIPGGVSAPKATPVRHVSINLGAPGFRADDRSRLWIPYPARGGEGILGGWLPKYQHNDSMCRRQSEDVLPIDGTDMPWVFTSAYLHTKPLKFTLVGPGQAPAEYTVRLYFAEPEDLTEGQRVFSVFLQEKEVLKNLDIAREAGSARKALVRSFKDVRITGDLTVRMQAADHAKVKTPILCGIEAVRE